MLHNEVKFIYTESKEPYDCTVKAQFYRDGNFIAEGLPYSILYFNALALAIQSLGEQMNCNEVNVRLSQQIEIGVHKW
jgi:hypothetical protein